jgi:anti-sigma regulatory factor (Ser/Thr protein kinase)
MHSNPEPASAAALTAQATVGEESLDAFELTVTAGPLAPGAARAAVSEWLSGRVVDGVLEDARLLLSELVTNCVQHADLTADASIGIGALLGDGTLRLEIRDSGRDGALTTRKPNRSEAGGYGLHLVETIATRWGVNRTAGTQVWFELADDGVTAIGQPTERRARLSRGGRTRTAH